jgi:2-amino-4,5-dihydroxy-6-oxo-7-(phosphonooxy)heptanoate synthase
VADGPIAAEHRFHQLVREVAEGGADAVVVHKGRARNLDSALLRNTALIVHLNASTGLASDANAKVMVGTVEDALRLGADAVSVQVNVGSNTESDQLADLGAVAGACDRWGMPLVAMAYPRGPRISDPHDPALLAHVVNIAADLGADLVKTTWANPLEALADVVASSHVPVVVAGGPAGRGDLACYAEDVMAAGCAGLAVGRRVFSDPDPYQTVRRLASIVHPGRDEPLLGAASSISLSAQVLAGSR